MQRILLFANEVLNTITAGTSTLRPLLFLAYVCAIIFLVFLLGWLQKRVRKSVFSARRVRAISIVAISSFSLLFLINIILQVSIFNEFGIPERSVAVGIYKGEITNTRLIHTHFGKIIVAEALSIPTKNLVLRSDTGRALLPYVPRPIVFLEIVLLCIGLITSGIASALYINAVKLWKRKICALALLSVLGFLVFEKAVDGGIFSDGAGLALLAYASILLLPLKRFVRIYPYLILGYAWVLIILCAFGFYWPQSYFVYTLERSGILALLIAAGTAAILGTWKYATISASILIVCMGLFVYANDASDRLYLNTRISPGAQYLSAYSEEVQPALPMVGSIGSLHVYDASSLAPSSIEQILERYNLPAAYYPLTRGDYSCAKPTVLKEGHFTVLVPSSHGITESHNNLFAATFTPEYPAPSGWNRYEGKITYNSCLSRYLDVLEQAITVAGSDTALVYNLELFSTQNTWVR